MRRHPRATSMLSRRSPPPAPTSMAPIKAASRPLTQRCTTPLHDAALGGDTGVVKILLDHGADVNARDTEADATPLYYAASWGRQAAVELLISRGADPNARNRKGASVLQSAIENNQPEI